MNGERASLHDRAECELRHCVPEKRTPSVGRRLRVIRQMGSEDDLRRAEELVAEARRIVQQQKGRIIRLRAAGVDTWDAERALRLFEANLRRFEEHRDILKSRR